MIRSQTSAITHTRAIQRGNDTALLSIFDDGVLCQTIEGFSHTTHRSSRERERKIYS